MSTFTFAEAPTDERALYWYAVDVERCVDGDTIVGTIQFGYHLSRSGQYFRLAGIDTPERGQPGFHEATDFLRERVEGKRIMVYSHADSSGRYKRIVAELFVDGVNINKALLDAGHAVVPHYL